MVANYDVIESSAVNAVTSLEGIHDEINGIREVYCNKFEPFSTQFMKLSEDIDHFSTDLLIFCNNSLSVRFGHCDLEKNEKSIFLIITCRF